MHEVAHNAWTNTGIDNKKIIMRVDLENILQVALDNQSVSSVKTVESDRIEFSNQFCPLGKLGDKFI